MVSFLSSLFIFVFSSTKFDIEFIDKNYFLTILESLPTKIFLNSKNSNFPCCGTLCIVKTQVHNPKMRHGLVWTRQPPKLKINKLHLWSLSPATSHGPGQGQLVCVTTL
jgi:hypothetical protein